MSRLLLVLATTALVATVTASAAPAKKAKAKAPTYTIEQATEKAEEALCVYDLDQAETMIEHLRTAIARTKQATEADRETLDLMQERLVLTRNMLDRVERIAIVDTMQVDSAGFFKHYILSPQAGRLFSNPNAPQPNVTYATEDNTQMIWAQPDDEGLFALMSTTFLGDGRAEAPQLLQGDLNGGGDANYPFLMPDGVTLYYANNGEGSLGGYDIFMTRKSDDGTWLQPQNVGMPYNSPYDDYLLAIDEVSGAGWWATNRDADPGMVTIYVFQPNEVRQNYSPDQEDLADLALLSELSMLPTADRKAQIMEQLAQIKSQQNADGDNSPAFTLAVPGHGVYTRLSDFSNAQAREAMAQYLDAKAEQQKAADHLQLLRQQYARGNRDVSTEILQLERRQQNAAAELLKLRNQAIRLEQ